MNIDKKKVLEIYMEWVEQVSEDCEDKTYFYPDEIVSKIVDIIEKMQKDASKNAT